MESEIPLPSESEVPADDGVGFGSVNAHTPVDKLPEMMTPAEVRAFLRIGRSLVYELIRAGDLPHVRYGRLVRVPRSAVIAREAHTR